MTDIFLNSSSNTGGVSYSYLNNWLTTKTTDNLAQGSSNLYFTSVESSSLNNCIASISGATPNASGSTLCYRDPSGSCNFNLLNSVSGSITNLAFNTAVSSSNLTLNGNLYINGGNGIFGPSVIDGATNTGIILIRDNNSVGNAGGIQLGNTSFGVSRDVNSYDVRVYSTSGYVRLSSDQVTGTHLDQFIMNGSGATVSTNITCSGTIVGSTVNSTNSTVNGILNASNIYATNFQNDQFYSNSGNAYFYSGSISGFADVTMLEMTSSLASFNGQVASAGLYSTGPLYYSGLAFNVSGGAVNANVAMSASGGIWGVTSSTSCVNITTLSGSQVLCNISGSPQPGQRLVVFNYTSQTIYVPDRALGIAGDIRCLPLTMVSCNSSLDLIWDSTNSWWNVPNQNISQVLNHDYVYRWADDTLLTSLVNSNKTILMAYNFANTSGSVNGISFTNNSSGTYYNLSISGGSPHSGNFTNALQAPKSNTLTGFLFVNKQVVLNLTNLSQLSPNQRGNYYVLYFLNMDWDGNSSNRYLTITYNETVHTKIYDPQYYSLATNGSTANQPGTIYAYVFRPELNSNGTEVLPIFTITNTSNSAQYFSIVVAQFTDSFQ